MQRSKRNGNRAHVLKVVFFILFLLLSKCSTLLSMDLYRHINISKHEPRLEVFKDDKNKTALLASILLKTTCLNAPYPLNNRFDLNVWHSWSQKNLYTLYSPYLNFFEQEHSPKRVLHSYLSTKCKNKRIPVGIFEGTVWHYGYIYISKTIFKYSYYDPFRNFVHHHVTDQYC